MAHYFTFSIIGAHIKNAEREINFMFDTDTVKVENHNYTEKEQEIFENNIKHGILALFSLNAALESLIAYLAEKLNINKGLKLDSEKSIFFIRIKKLKNLKVITDNISLNTCIEFREYRNLVTHLEKKNLIYMELINIYP